MGKSERRRQRNRADDLIDDLLADRPDYGDITPEALTAAEKEGLADEGNLELFALYYSWGGMAQPPSIVEMVELANMAGSAALVKDFGMLMKRLTRAQRGRK